MSLLRCSHTEPASLWNSVEFMLPLCPLGRIEAEGTVRPRLDGPDCQLAWWSTWDVLGVRFSTGEQVRCCSQTSPWELKGVREEGM